MKRRHLLAAAAPLLTVGAGPASAQQPMPRVGFLKVGEPEPALTQFQQAMADLGYIADRTVRYDARSGEASQLGQQAAALVALDVDVIVAVLTPAIAAARAATTTIPIVFNGGAPATGIVTNYARPEGNLTGIWGATTVLAGKSVQLFHEIKPAAKALGVLLNASDPFHVPLMHEISKAGGAEKIEIVPMMLKGHDELPAAVRTLASRGIDGVLVQPSLPLKVAADLTLKNRLPAISYRREFVNAGGLIFLGPDQVAIAEILAGYVDRVLKGTRTSDLPVQQATKFDLVVNQRTAKALGLVLPPMFLAAADEVIE